MNWLVSKTQVHPTHLMRPVELNKKILEPLSAINFFRILSSIESGIGRSALYSKHIDSKCFYLNVRSHSFDCVHNKNSVNHVNGKSRVHFSR